MHYYCTYFDRNYLYKGLTLYQSLTKHDLEAVLYVLCFDDITFQLLSDMQLERMRLVSLEEFEEGDARLREAKQSRSKVEYYWTCTPSLLLYVLRQTDEIDLLTYLDSDLFFFDSPEPVFREFGDGSILITEHRYPERLKHLEVAGRFNVQFISVRRDQNGIDCLEWWRSRCLDWCFNRLEDGKFGDQKYLDHWPRLFGGVHILQHRGAGVAPWNFSQYEIIEDSEGDLLVDGEPLVFYHFHQFRILAGNRFYYASSVYSADEDFPAAVYLPYTRAILDSIDTVRMIEPGFNSGIESQGPVTLEAAARKYLPATLKNAIKRIFSAR